MVSSFLRGFPVFVVSTSCFFGLKYWIPSSVWVPDTPKMELIKLFGGSLDEQFLGGTSSDIPDWIHKLNLWGLASNQGNSWGLWCEV